MSDCIKPSIIVTLRLQNPKHSKYVIRAIEVIESAMPTKIVFQEVGASNKSKGYTKTKIA